MKRIYSTILSTLLISGCVTTNIPHNEKITYSAMEFDLTDGYLNGGEAKWEKLDEIIRVARIGGVLKLNWVFRFKDVGDLYCPNDLIDISQMPKKLSSAYFSYGLPMNTYSSHFVMDVIVGSPIDYPFSYVTCVNTGGDDFTITVKGYYSAAEFGIPTAYKIEFRPLYPYKITTNPALKDEN